FESLIWSLMSIMNRQSSVIRRPSSVLRSTTVENSLQITPFYAKQTQFSELLNNVNSSHTRIYEEIRPEYVTKKQTQFKPNSKPI
ncbi:MAG: hypothetical protein RQ760_21595, partial [Sedimentisphaerales bacterium]|nr:hypothetical protein [Sedimentisphaerales bacterium]